MESRNLDSWTTYDPEDVGSASLRARAKKRSVIKVDDREWVVLGNTKLGDALGSYRVTLAEGSTRYECDCYQSEHGDTRRRRMCSMVLAVIMCRRGQMDYLEDRTEDQTSSETADSDQNPGGGGVVVPFRPRSVEPPQFPPGLTPTPPSGPLTPQDPSLGYPPLPAKFVAFRQPQLVAIEEIMDAYAEPGVKVVFLGAPTGSGKTVIGETIRRLMGTHHAVYCCTTKSLQNQVVHDFDYGRVIKGRNNYKTLLRPDLTTEDCDGKWEQGEGSCSWCPSMKLCPYRVAKEQAAKSELPILNMAYFLNEIQGMKSVFAHRQLAIIDEADTLEQQLLGFFEVVISPRARQQLGVASLPKKTVSDDWGRWIREEIIPAIEARRKALTAQGTLFKDENVKRRRERRRLDSLMAQARLLTSERGVEGDVSWVLESWSKNDRSPQVVFKPVRVTDFTREVFWERGRKFLLMSATLVSPDQMAEELGLEEHEWRTVEMDSSFPPERRPIIYQPEVAMTHKTKDQAYPQMAEAISAIVDANPGVRILVHTVSYHLTRFIWDHIQNPRFVTYWNAWERDRALEKFLSKPDSVLLAPSFERGVDLPGEDCEIQIIAKVPYPNLGDTRVKARFYAHGGKTWYAIETIRSLVQMTGRGMRSADDWCDTYILDRQFGRLWKDHKRLFPKWWSEALVVSALDPRTKHLVEAAKSRQASRT